MMLPLVKLGSLAFRTLSKPIAARLKYNAGIHPKFRGLIIGLAQVIDAPSRLAYFFVLQSVRRCLVSFRFAMEKFLLAVRFSVSCKLRLLERLIVFSQYGFDDAAGVPRFLMFLACHNVRGMSWLIAFDLMRNACGMDLYNVQCCLGFRILSPYWMIYCIDLNRL